MKRAKIIGTILVIITALLFIPEAIHKAAYYRVLIHLFNFKFRFIHFAGIITVLLIAAVIVYIACKWGRDILRRYLICTVMLLTSIMSLVVLYCRDKNITAEKVYKEYNISQFKECDFDDVEVIKDSKIKIEARGANCINQDYVVGVVLYDDEDMKSARTYEEDLHINTEGKNCTYADISSIVDLRKTKITKNAMDHTTIFIIIDNKVFKSGIVYKNNNVMRNLLDKVNSHKKYVITYKSLLATLVLILYFLFILEIWEEPIRKVYKRIKKKAETIKRRK